MVIIFDQRDDKIILNKFYSRLTKPMVYPGGISTTNSKAHLTITCDQFKNVMFGAEILETIKYQRHSHFYLHLKCRLISETI